MLIAKVQDGQVLEVADYKAMFPNTSFSAQGINESFYAENGLMPVSLFKPHDRDTEQLVACVPYIEGGQVFTVSVEPLSAADLASRSQALAAQVRSQRDAMLLSCDWTQGRDIPDAITQPWAAYRQALRDVPAQAGFPEQVDWPVQPGAAEPVTSISGA